MGNSICCCPRSRERGLQIKGLYTDIRQPLNQGGFVHSFQHYSKGSGQIIVISPTSPQNYPPQYYQSHPPMPNPNQAPYPPSPNLHSNQAPYPPSLNPRPPQPPQSSNPLGLINKLIKKDYKDFTQEYMQNSYIKGQKWKISLIKLPGMTKQKKNQNKFKQQILINNWKKKLKQLKGIFKQQNGTPNLVSNQFWEYCIKQFDYFPLNLKEKMAFLDIANLYIKENSKRRLSAEKFQQFFYSLGQEFRQFINELQQKQARCHKYLNFMTGKYSPKKCTFPSLKFMMQQQQVMNLCAVVKQFFSDDPSSFAFISLYFHISINNLLKIKDINVQFRFKRILTLMKQKYPPNDKLLKEEQKTKSEMIQSIKCQYEFETIEIDKEKEDVFEQLVEFIREKAQAVVNEELTFIALLKPVCLQKGRGFKTALKIKSVKDNIFRTVEKVIEDIYKKQVQSQTHLQIQFQQYLRQSYSFNQSLQVPQQPFIQLVKQQMKNVQKVITKILKQNPINFAIKDLVRGKCVFSSVQDIHQTVQRVKKVVADKDHQIIQIKNRLERKQKDVVLILKINQCIAELQLAYDQDYLANEFNHKFYELERSQIFSKITNLFLNDIEWSTRFFRELFQFFQLNALLRPDMQEHQQEATQQMQSIVGFAEKFLQPNMISQEKRQPYEDKIQIDRQTFRIQQKLKQFKRRINKSIQKKISLNSEQIQDKEKDNKQSLNKQYHSDQQPLNYEESQKSNEIHFLLAFIGVGQAETVWNQIHQVQINS